MAAYSTLGLIWRRSGFGRGVSKLVCGRGGGGNRVSRSFSSVGSVTTDRRMSPWLMLPPASEEGSMVYKFFSLAENRVLSFNWSDGRADNCSDFDPHDKDAQVVGSSKGWLCLMNKITRQMDLINPITRCRVKLPSLHLLEDYTDPLSLVTPSKMILSSSPDEEGGKCRALITYSERYLKLDDIMAYCCPGRSEDELPRIGAEWTRIGREWGFNSFVYSRRQGLFYCAGNHGEMEMWDLRCPFDLMGMMDMSKSTEIEFPYEIDDRFQAFLASVTNPKKWFHHFYHFLVLNEDTDDLFVVRRFIRNDNPTPSDGVKTMFEVHRYDPKSQTFQYMDRSLDGLSFFIGNNTNGLAVSAEEFPELKPNSIYFVLNNDPLLYSDMGIYNYQDATISPLCDDGHVKNIPPELRWFTPNTSN